MMCEACIAGRHRFCGMQTWCECEHEDDGAANDAEWEAYQLWLEDMNAARHR